MSLHSLPETRLKVVVVGPARVGKTALVNQWAGLPVPKRYLPTQGVRECQVRRDFMETSNACLVFYDVGSYVIRDRYRAAELLRGADVVVLVYTECSEVVETVGQLRDTWVPLAKKWAPNVFKVILSTYKVIKDRYQEEEDFYNELDWTLMDFCYCSLVHCGVNEEEVLQKLFRYAKDGLQSKAMFNEQASSVLRDGAAGPSPLPAHTGGPGVPGQGGLHDGEGRLPGLPCRGEPSGTEQGQSC